MKKSAHPINDKAGAPGMGTAIVNPGCFPEKLATVTSEVLSRMLQGERLTSLDAVFGASTTRLAAVVCYLEKHHRWTIDREDRAAGCRDGRLSWVTEYRLLPELIEASLAAGSDVWCRSVTAARAKLRRRAADAKWVAARANEKRRFTRRGLSVGDLLEAEGPDDVDGV